MSIFHIFKTRLGIIFIFGVLSIFTGCHRELENMDNVVVVSFDTSDAIKTYQVFSKYSKPKADSLYRSLLFRLFKQKKYDLIEQHLIKYRKIDSGSKTNVAISNIYHGLIVLQHSEYDSAMLYIDQALKNIKADDCPMEYLIALSTKAFCFTGKGDYDHAIGIRYQTIGLCEKNKDTVGEYQELGELGIAYLMTKDFKKATILIDSSLQFFKVKKDETLEAYFLSAKSVILYSYNLSSIVKVL